MTKKVVVVNMAADGEISAAALVVQKAGKFASQIYLEYGTKRINAKSIMGVMTLPLSAGEEMCLTADGADEDEAIRVLSDYLAK